MSLTSEFESMLFENKEEIPQTAYVKMMNELKEKNKKEKKEGEMYIIFYLEKKLSVVFSEGSLDIEMFGHMVEPKKQKTYIKLSSNQYEFLQGQLPKPINYSPHLIEYDERDIIYKQGGNGNGCESNCEYITMEAQEKCMGCITSNEDGCCLGECSEDLKIVSIPVNTTNIYIISSITKM
jgi:hypothetical protein